MVPHEALVVALTACFSAQALKPCIQLVRGQRPGLRAALGTGGMPSSHSALVVGLCAAVGLRQGFEHPLFDVALAFALIVMYDATGLRQAAGRQARVINQMMQELSQLHISKQGEHLKELLGHTRLEVVGGALWGMIVAVAFRLAS